MDQSTGIAGTYQHLVARLGQKVENTISDDQLGGLHVIVSERNESKRIDRQLVGRCARQGQPGTVRMYSCLEDEIIQTYGLRQKLNILASKPWVFEKFLISAQKLAQKQAFIKRKGLMQNDDWLNDALSFVRTGFAE